MKLDYYEVPFGTEGRTIGVTTVNIFEKDRNIEDDGRNVIKKIKTKQEQVKAAMKDFARSILVKPVPIEQNPIPEKKEEEVYVEPVVEEAKEIKDEVVEPEVGHRYSFETVETVSREPAKDAYQVNSLNTDTAYRNDSRIQYDNFYSKLDPVEKLREEFKKQQEGTYAHKVLKIGISEASKYEISLEENDREQVSIEEEMKKLQSKLDSLKTVRLSIDKEKRDYANVVLDAYKQACQLDAYDKATKEAEIKREQEAAARQAKEEAEKRATAARRAEMLARIPVELQEEPAKTPVSVQNVDVFNRFRSMEEQVETFDFKKSGRAA